MALIRRRPSDFMYVINMFGGQIKLPAGQDGREFTELRCLRRNAGVFLSIVPRSDRTRNKRDRPSGKDSF